MSANYVPGNPTNITTMTVTGIRRIIFESKLRRDSVRPSVFTDLKAAIKVVDKALSIKQSGIFMEISVPPEGGQSTRLSMSLPLQAAPNLGTARVLGNEDETDLVWTELFYNEVKKGVKYKKWGYDYNDTRYLNYLERYADQLTGFMAEYYDVRCQQALIITYADELAAAPVSRAQQFNKNWCIPNLAEGDYPTFDTTTLTKTTGSTDGDGYYSDQTFSGVGTFVENIAAAMLSASGTGSTSNALFTVDFLTQLEQYMSDTMIGEAVEIDGIPTYVIVVASPVWAWTGNPNNTGSIAEHMQTVASYRFKDRPIIPGELGRIRDNLLLVRNRRAPTIQIDGSLGSYTMEIDYCNPGNNDDRNKSDWSNTSGSTNYRFDMCYGLCANALCEYIVDPMVSNLTEQTEYTQIEGRACYVGSGLQAPNWDLDSASQTATTRIYRGSCLIPVSYAPAETVV